MTATSVVPPPISTIMFPLFDETRRPLPIAAAMGAIFVPQTELTWADLFRNPLYLAIGFFGSLIFKEKLGLFSYLAIIAALLAVIV